MPVPDRVPTTTPDLANLITGATPADQGKLRAALVDQEGERRAAKLWTAAARAVERARAKAEREAAHAAATRPRGRPRVDPITTTGRTEQIGWRAHDDLLDRVDALCERLRMSKSDAVRAALVLWFATGDRQVREELRAGPSGNGRAGGQQFKTAVPADLLPRMDSAAKALGLLTLKKEPSRPAIVRHALAAWCEVQEAALAATGAVAGQELGVHK